MQRRIDRWNPRRVCGAACAVIALVCAAAVSGIRTFSHATDYVCVLAAVAAYVVAIVFGWRIWPHAAGVAAGAVAAPLLALALLALSSGPAALPALGSLVLMVAAPPQYTEEASPTLSCRVYDEPAYAQMYIVYVYRHPPFFPVVQREVARVPVDATGPGDRPRAASCASVAAALRS